MMARKRKEGLSDRQVRVLEVLDRFQRRSGYPPSIREIQFEAELSSTSVVNYYLDQLEEMGLIERDEHKSRGIRLLKPIGEIVSNGARRVQQVIEGTLRVPIMGRIFASQPVPVPASSFSYTDAESTVDVALSMLPEREADKLFALEVRGDSMIDAMVYDGDVVIMKPSQLANIGEMVAIWLSDRDETTLKYFYKQNNRIRLQPANPTMKPIYIDDPSVVQVQGKVVMVIRSVGNQIKH